MINISFLDYSNCILHEETNILQIKLLYLYLEKGSGVTPTTQFLNFNPLKQNFLQKRQHKLKQAIETN